ncbi:MAG: trehalose-phosphatase [Alphaproteobacteria bacterium]|nr:trehalose-phosphatase [Alphaproteobacteria bacterium]
MELNLSQSHAPVPRRDWALFLDIDGTLIDIAPSPDAVKVSDTLAASLAAAGRWLAGALAIVSGRTFAKIDELMAPLVLPCAGEHGAVIRLPDGAIRNAGAEHAVPNAWRERVHVATRNWHGVIAEFKPYSIAVHFRQAPARERDVRCLLETIVAGSAPNFEILSARMAFEIRHRSVTKGAAVHELMKHTPFFGRTPVFVGDDVTDEDGFRAARDLGGLALHVNEAFGGEPSNVRRWLKTFQPPNEG